MKTQGRHHHCGGLFYSWCMKRESRNCGTLLLENGSQVN